MGPMAVRSPRRRCPERERGRERERESLQTCSAMSGHGKASSTISAAMRCSIAAFRQRGEGAGGGLSDGVGRPRATFVRSDLDATQNNQGLSRRAGRRRVPHLPCIVLCTSTTYACHRLVPYTVLCKHINPCSSLFAHVQRDSLPIARISMPSVKSLGTYSCISKEPQPTNARK